MSFFSQDKLNQIFRISSKNPDCITSRESTELEFKLSFGWNSLGKYLKSMAGFANNKGGYIVFGIENKPHRMVGLQENSLHLFESMDPEKLTNHLNDYFSPEISWYHHTHELDGRVFGLIYTEESKNTPVLCKKNGDSDLKEGDIYYRYRGVSQKIRYPELKTILEQNRFNEQQMWMKHLAKISQIGVRDTGIFNLQTGEVTGSGNSSFLIDEALLSQLSIIKEGTFSEVKGKPTLKLIGNLEPIGKIKGTGKIVKTKGIRLGDIVLGFLKGENIAEPTEYIKQICHESTGFLPVYYYIHKAGLTLQSTIVLLNQVVSRSPARQKLVERLSSSSTLHSPLGVIKTNASKKKSEFVLKLLDHAVEENLQEGELTYCIQAILGLTDNLIIDHSEYLMNFLVTLFNKNYTSANSTVVTNLRRAICWVDEALYKGAIDA